MLAHGFAELLVYNLADLFSVKPVYSRHLVLGLGLLSRCGNSLLLTSDKHGSYLLFNTGEKNVVDSSGDLSV